MVKWKVLRRKVNLLQGTILAFPEGTLQTIENLRPVPWHRFEIHE
jgi:hypothetical protein